MPRLVGPVASLLRRTVISRLRAMWSIGSAIDILLPSGEKIRIGSSSTTSTKDAIPCLRVHDDRLFLRLLLRGEMGGGESYVAGEWSADDLPAVVRMFLRATGARGFESPLTWLAQVPALLKHRRAANSVAGSQRNIHSHYDLGNTFYRLFLDDDTMAYSCALWPEDSVGAPLADATRTLADAQRAKFERLCAMMELSPSDHLLEIGCGWGGMALHAATTRGCRVTAITVSREQHELARAKVAQAGLSDRVDIQYRDYRDLDGSFDKVVSIEMLEAVGYEYLPGYFATCGRVLRPGGVMALQSITMPDDRFESYRHRVDWMQTYIFPGSLIPSLRAIRDALPGSGLAIRSSHDIGPHYAPTLRSWTQHFMTQMPAVRSLGFDTPFVRTWLMYLAFSEAAFAERTLGDHQILLTR